MRVNKRGEANTAIDWFIAMIITALTFIFLMLIVSSYTSRNVPDDGIEAETVFASIYYNNQLFSEYFGVIERARFTQEEVNKNLKYKESIAINITLIEPGHEAKSVFVNENIYYQLKPFVDAGVSGEGSAVSRTTQYPILIREGQKDVQGILHVEVLVR